MTSLTILWLILPFFIGFSIYLLPRADRVLTLGVALASVGYAAVLLAQPAPLAFSWLDSFSVTVIADGLSGYFILTNALVTAAVVLYCWDTSKTAFFYTQAIILHGSVNAAFICADFISLYVALEVIGISAALLIAYSRNNRSLWVALRYLFVSNTAMLFYLVGAVLVYQSQGSFAFAGFENASAEAKALIVLGLVVKGGIFVSGLWLPLTHAEAESPVSAILSGVVVKAGVFPLVRLALTVEAFAPLAGWLGTIAALFGVAYALVQTDAKRVLACSTLSQLGWILAVPEAAGFYALAHGLAKATLFLGVGNLPTRNLTLLRQQPIHTSLWVPITLASLSISGFPLFAGFGAKMLALKQALTWQTMALNIAAVGTATIYARFIFLPHQASDGRSGGAIKPGLWMAVPLLIGALLVANLIYPGAYTGFNIVKVLGVIIGGWLLHLLLLQRLTLVLPSGPENFENLIGTMSLILLALFWVGWSWLV